MTHRVNIPRHTLRRWTVIKMLASETPFAAFCKQAASFDMLNTSAIFKNYFSKHDQKLPAKSGAVLCTYCSQEMRPVVVRFLADLCGR
ncbi:hypothetical protein T12_10353 [Trichinella patagoniensis]|uniref:Uncharacterized protein n=1 Tax=Trichinella patagoniensis TaxID=990121 RepID=A0A0V0ZY41_9BILA|nr:hypothetical protein T12_10353 [Trichinella patagoniensis]